LWITAETQSVCALMPGQPDLVVGDAIRFGFDAAARHWFDKQGTRWSAAN